MAETMRENKVTNITNTNQYHLVVVFNRQKRLYNLLLYVFWRLAARAGDPFRWPGVKFGTGRATAR